MRCASSTSQTTSHSDTWSDAVIHDFICTRHFAKTIVTRLFRAPLSLDLHPSCVVSIDSSPLTENKPTRLRPWLPPCMQILRQLGVHVFRRGTIFSHLFPNTLPAPLCACSSHAYWDSLNTRVFVQEGRRSLRAPHVESPPVRRASQRRRRECPAVCIYRKIDAPQLYPFPFEADAARVACRRAYAPIPSRQTIQTGPLFVWVGDTSFLYIWWSTGWLMPGR